MSKFFTHYGQWAVDEIKVKIISDTIVYIEYEKYEVNAFKYTEVVWLNPIDKLLGKTLEQKIDDKFSSIKNKLIKDNQKIKARQDLEKKYRKI